MRGRRLAGLLVGLLLLALLAGALWLGVRGRRGRSASTDEPEQSWLGGAAAPGSGASRTGPTGAPGERRLGSPLRIDGAQRARLLAAIQRRLAEHKGGAGAAGSTASAPPSAASGGATGTLDKDYIRERIREILPLVKECYELALAQGAASGVLKVRFSIVGDPELGGVIEESQILEETELARNTSLAECVQETMYALQLKAPKGGGRVKVTYPFRFESDGQRQPR